FCKFAKEHNIVIICLPSHTTHVLQPCDIGVFGPLASSWKAQVNRAAREYIPITKYNLLIGTVTGNPGVHQGQPVPQPVDTHTQKHGYGFMAGAGHRFGGLHGYKNPLWVECMGIQN
ncbi:hypothetical protein BYT27DRAFT_7088493, partial [Phlegmacium glaucopus]